MAKKPTKQLDIWEIRLRPVYSRSAQMPTVSSYIASLSPLHGRDVQFKRDTRVLAIEAADAERIDPQPAKSTRHHAAKKKRPAQRRYQYRAVVAGKGLSTTPLWRLSIVTKAIGRPAASLPSLIAHAQSS